MSDSASAGEIELAPEDGGRDRLVGPAYWLAVVMGSAGVLLTVNQTFNLHMFGEPIIDTSFYYLLLGLFLSLAFLAYPARKADRLAIELVVFPVAALFFSIDLGLYGPGLLLIACFATPGIAAAGTLFGSMTVRTQARDLALSVVLFPLLSPVLLTAVAGTRALLAGAEPGELLAYVKLLGVFDLAFVAGGLSLFGTLIED
jgi:hypothetical protein